MAARHNAVTIRNVTSRDGAALQRLFACVGIDTIPMTTADIAGYLERGRLIVLEVDSAIGAAAHILLDHINDDEIHARVQFLVIHPALTGTGAEDRMAAAVLAVCEAAGCVDVDVMPIALHPAEGR